MLPHTQRNPVGTPLEITNTFVHGCHCNVSLDQTSLHKILQLVVVRSKLAIKALNDVTSLANDNPKIIMYKRGYEMVDNLRF